MDEKYQYLWSSSQQGILPGRPVYTSSQFSGRNFNSMIHDSKENQLYKHTPHNWDSSLGTTKPEANYGNKYSSNMHMKPLFNFSTPGVPQSSYLQRERLPTGYSSSEEPEFPHRIGYAQINYNY